MANAAARPEISQAECTGCGDCIPICPTDALILIDSRVSIVADVDCSYCGECEESCPAGAILCPYEIECEEDTAG